MAANAGKHVRIVCFILKVLGVLYLIGAVAFLVMGTTAFFNQGNSGFASATAASPTGAVVLIPLVLFGVLHILAARGFTINTRWARSLLWIFSLLNLTNIPFGTAFGAYSIWVLYQTREC